MNALFRRTRGNAASDWARDIGLPAAGKTVFGVWALRHYRGLLGRASVAWEMAL